MKFDLNQVKYRKAVLYRDLAQIEAVEQARSQANIRRMTQSHGENEHEVRISNEYLKNRAAHQRRVFQATWRGAPFALKNEHLRHNLERKDFNVKQRR